MLGFLIIIMVYDTSKPDSNFFKAPILGFTAFGLLGVLETKSFLLWQADHPKVWDL